MFTNQNCQSKTWFNLNSTPLFVLQESLSKEDLIEKLEDFKAKVF